jgi:hypothetical protein
MEEYSLFPLVFYNSFTSIYTYENDRGKSGVSQDTGCLEHKALRG